MRVTLLSLSVPMTLVLLLAGCELLGDTRTPDYGQIESISYTRHVQFLFDERCTSCHEGATAEAGLRLSDWDAVVDGSDFGAAIVPFAPERSELIAMVTRLSGGAHPSDAGEDLLPAIEIDFLRRWIADGARSDDGRVPYADAVSRVYTAGSVLTIIDAGRLAVASTVDLDELGFSAARFVAAAPDGSAWYVSLPAEDAVIRLTPGGQLNGLVSVSSAGPISVSRDGTLIAVGRDPEAARDESIVSVIRAQDLSVQTVDVGIARPSAVAIHPLGYVIAASFDLDRIAATYLTDGSVHSFSLSGSRQGISSLAISDDGTRMFGLAEIGGRVLVIDTTDPTQMTQLGTVDAGAAPSGIAVGTTRIGVSGAGTDTFTLIDPVRGALSNVVRGLGISAPTGVAAAGDYFFISSQNRTGQYVPRHAFDASTPLGVVTVVDPMTGLIVRNIDVDPLSVSLAGNR